jgi:Zn-finger nucleic acid-binding protein
MCPNCDGSMQAVNRAGVEFDMCPKCRGVWLDRGELEKLMAMEREDAQGQFQGQAQAQAAPPPRPQQPPPAYAQPQYSRPDHYGDRRHYDDDDRHRYKKDGHYGHHKKKRFDLFDIFD